MFALAMVVLLGLAAPQDEEVFLGTLSINEVSFAVMSSTEVTLDGKRVPYLDVPDEGVELREVSINLKRRVYTRLVYVTKRET